MKPHPECSLCMLKWIYERATNSLEDERRFHIAKKLMHAFAEELHPAVELGMLCNKTLEAVYDVLPESSRPYGDLKRKSNQAAAGLLEDAKDFVDKSKTPEERLEKACALAAVGNVAPIGVPSAPFEFSMIKDIITGAAAPPAPSGDLHRAASRAQNVFYIADNAGEIAFDSLVIALLKDMGCKVTLLVKEGPFFDDATFDDVRFFGLERTADAVYCVKRGFFVPGAGGGDLDSLFDRSDLVVSKGTGNFEAVKGNTGGKPTLFLLKSKCPPVAEETGTPQGEFVVRLETTDDRS